MTGQTPVEQVVSHLEKAGFRRLTKPLEIASLRFDFPAVLVSGDSESDLVVVADTVEEDGIRIQKKLEGIARALDVLGSRRSITAVVAGPRPKNEIIDDMARVCRILPIGDTADATLEGSLKNWLRVLTPLSIEDLGSQTSDPIAKLHSAEDMAENKIFQDLISASFQSAEEVTEKIQTYFRSALEPLAAEE
jgi:hypothetical protein